MDDNDTILLECEHMNDCDFWKVIKLSHICVLRVCNICYVQIRDHVIQEAVAKITETLRPPYIMSEPSCPHTRTLSIS